MMGIPCLNGAVAIARSRDKLRAMQLLTKKDIDVPITVCARTPKDLDLMLELVGGTPVIVKLQQGTQGIGVMIAETRQAVSSLLETLWGMGQDIVVQQYIAESKGRDVRAFVVGGRVIASMRRSAKAGEFRSNLHRGGAGHKVVLDQVYQRRRSLRRSDGARGRRRRHARERAGAEDPRDQLVARPRRDRARDRDRRGRQDPRAGRALR